jgi:hypothetical protein
MTSQRKIEANRRNALRSSGPRTTAGKARSRRNAFKHGLAIPLNRDESFADRAEMFAAALTPLFAKPPEILRLAAEWQTEIERIQQTRVAMINREIEQQASTAADAANDETHIAAAVAAALPDLVRFERYERRAASRLRKALRSFENE